MKHLTTRSIRALIIMLTSSLFIATQSFAANLDSSDMTFAFGNSEQSTNNMLDGELALLSADEMLTTEGEFIPLAVMFWGSVINLGFDFTKSKLVKDYQMAPFKKTLMVGAGSALFGHAFSQQLLGLRGNDLVPVTIANRFKKSMNNRWSGYGK